MKKNHRILILLLILTIGIFFRIYHLGTESIWLDEGISIHAAKLSVSQILANSKEEQHPPLYYSLLHYWISIFGDSEFAVRFLSMLFGFLGIFVIYKIGKLIYDENAGILSAFLLAMSVYHIQYSQEARMYSLLSLLTLISFYFFLKILKENNSILKVGYILSSLLLMYTHLYGLFVIIAQNIFIATVFIMSSKKRGINIKRWIYLQGILLILFLPWARILLIQIAWTRRDFWIPGPTFERLYETFVDYAGSRKMLLLMLMILPFSVVNYKKLEGIFNWNKISESLQSIRWEVRLSRPSNIYLLGVWLLTPIIFPCLISLFTTPIYWPRYTIEASLAFYILVAIGIIHIQYKIIKIIILGLVVILSLLSISSYYNNIKNEEWRDIAHYIDVKAKGTDLILLSNRFDKNYAQQAFDYYYKRKDIIEMQFYLVNDTVVIGNKEKNEFEKIVNKYDRVWVINSPFTKEQRDLTEKKFGDFYNMEWHKESYGKDVRFDAYLFSKRK